jgi:hypothetical protein
MLKGACFRTNSSKFMFKLMTTIIEPLFLFAMF